jgi:hypothetical protein
MHPVKFEFRDPQPISCLAPRSGRHECFYSGQRFCVLPPHEVQELPKKRPIVTLLLASLLRRTQVRGVFVAEVINRAKVFVYFLSLEGEGSGTTKSILRPLGIHRSELVREAEIDVITEPGFVRPVVPQRIPQTKSRWAQLARSGEKVMQFLSAGRCVANVVDGKVNLYGGRGVFGCEFPSDETRSLRRSHQ